MFKKRGSDFNHWEIGNWRIVFGLYNYLDGIGLFLAGVFFFFFLSGIRGMFLGNILTFFFPNMLFIGRLPARFRGIPR